MSLSHPNKNKGVALVIYRENISSQNPLEYLLLHRFNPWIGWGLLKGGCESNSERFTVEKEIREEAKLLEGRDYRKNDVHRVQDSRIIYTTHRLKKRNYQVYAVKVSPQARVQVDFKENDDYLWAEFEKAKRMLRHEATKIALENGNEFVKSLEEKKIIPKL